MPDPRFYERLSSTTVGELAGLTGAILEDPSRASEAIRGVASLAAAASGDVTFCVDRRHAGALAATAASACFLPRAVAGSGTASCVSLITATPQAAYAMAVDRLYRPRSTRPGAPPIDPSARIGPGVEIGPGVVIGPDAEIGVGTTVGPGAYIGAGVTIGRDCVIGPRAVLVFARLGDRVRVHGGAIIGEPGFGAAAGPRGVIDVPQLGRVILNDGVTVGANSCIDRGAFDDTVVGENTKIDNLVQIAHNVVIGRNCLLAAFTGISGSTVVGDGCVFGGRAGVSDHVKIGAGARVAAASGVMKDIPAGESWGGSPARPVVRWMRETAWLARLAKRRAGSEDRP